MRSFNAGQATKPSGQGKPGPTVTSISPATGVDELDTVTITGNHFSDHGATLDALTVNGDAVVGTVVSNTSITFPAPAFPTDAPIPELILTTSNGTWTQPLAFAYAIPVLTSLDPATGSPDGGDAIDLVGTHFSDDMIVLVDGVENGTVVVSSETAAVWTTGANVEDTVDVAVRSVLGDSNTLVGAFEYVVPPPPELTSILFNDMDGWYGPGNPDPYTDTAVGIAQFSGDPYKLTGLNFQAAGAGINHVFFGDVEAANVVTVSDTEITCDNPGLGSAPFPTTPTVVNITVVNDLGTSNPVDFTFAPRPLATSCTPSSGPAAGGTNVSIVGTGFKFLGLDPESVRGPLSAYRNVHMGAPCTNVVYVDDTHITATTAAGTGAVQVHVFGYWFDEGLSDTDLFTYT